VQRENLESAAAKYTYLRGMLYLPLGVVLILSALANREVGPLRHTWAFPVAALVVGATYLPISRYYNEHYGRLSPSTRQQVRAVFAAVAGVAVMLGGSSLARSHAPWSLDLPINAIAASFALVMLISYAVGVGVRAHHAIIWGALLIVGALPVWNGTDPSNVGLVLAAVALIVDGVFDHRLFVQTFGPPARASLGESDAAA
jgi:hypothetical protein